MDWQAASRFDLPWSDFSGRSGRLLRSKLQCVFYIAIACLTTAGFLTAAISLIDQASTRLALMVGTVLALVTSQLLARWLYFSSVVFARMPGAST
jgi:predicted membrane channel-forming protein YqfA (hemolysin III family)